MINAADFTSVEELTRWTLDLDRRGLRATGSAEHKDYVDDLVRRLGELGVSDVRTEPQSMRRWTPANWALTVDGAPIPTSSFVSYSGNTGPQGVSGLLARHPAAGTIGFVEVPAVGFPMAMFDGLDWDAPDQPVHVVEQDPNTPFERVWLSQDLMRAALARFEQAGAVALVIVVDLPAEHITDGYLLYDGVHRRIPAVFVSREVAGTLRDAEASGAPARLVLDASIETTQTHNVVGLIPGMSDELIVLQSHTDGTNGLEDNGPEAILAMAGYLAKLPREQLPRTVLVLLTTGHFAIEEAWGVEHFLASHADDLVPRIAAVLSLEHLGALPSRVDKRARHQCSRPRVRGILHQSAPRRHRQCPRSNGFRGGDRGPGAPAVRPRCLRSVSRWNDLAGGRWPVLARRRPADSQFHHRTGLPAQCRVGDGFHRCRRDASPGHRIYRGGTGTQCGAVGRTTRPDSGRCCALTRALSPQDSVPELSPRAGTLPNSVRRPGPHSPCPLFRPSGWCRSNAGYRSGIC